MLVDAGPRISSYRWAGGREALLRWGPDHGPTVIVALPLFEEANRTRATITALLQALAARGIGGALPDLPGTGDSSTDTSAARLGDWQAAFVAAAASLAPPIHALAVRGGALVIAGANVASTWLLSPQTGASAVRELTRVRALGDDGLFAGNDLHPDLLAALGSAEPPSARQLRVVRLAGDPRPADKTLAFAPPWRAAEPHRDMTLAGALADDVAQWVAACGA